MAPEQARGEVEAAGPARRRVQPRRHAVRDADEAAAVRRATNPLVVLTRVVGWTSRRGRARWIRTCRRISRRSCSSASRRSGPRATTRRGRWPTTWAGSSAGEPVEARAAASFGYRLRKHLRRRARIVAGGGDGAGVRGGGADVRAARAAAGGAARGAGAAVHRARGADRVDGALRGAGAGARPAAGSSAAARRDGRAGRRGRALAARWRRGRATTRSGAGTWPWATTTGRPRSWPRRGRAGYREPRAAYALALARGPPLPARAARGGAAARGPAPGAAAGGGGAAPRAGAALPAGERRAGGAVAGVRGGAARVLRGAGTTTRSAQLDGIARSGDTPPWFYEAPLLRGEVLWARARARASARQARRARQRGVTADLAAARRALDTAAAIGRSEPAVHGARAELELSALGVELYGGGAVDAPFARGVEAAGRALDAPARAIRRRWRSARAPAEPRRSPQPARRGYDRALDAGGRRRAVGR